MFKLVCIGGKLRGQEFILENGANSLGKDADNKIILDLEGISKHHALLTPTQDGVYLEDLKSSNGTFVNSKMIRAMTIKDGDQIALPNLIFQLVYVKEKKIIIKKKIIKDNPDGQADYQIQEPDMPAHLPGKILHLFEYKVMPLLYEFNKEYEWKVMVAILLGAYVFCAISLSILPVFRNGRLILEDEIKTRGFHYVEEVARLNSMFLFKNQFESIDTRFLEDESGIESHVLFDVEGRILSPLTRVNTYIQDTFSIFAKEEVLKQKLGKSKLRLGAPFMKSVDDKYGMAKAIYINNPETGEVNLVGIIAIVFAPRSLMSDAANNSKDYLESLIVSALVAVLFFGFVYFLTNHALYDMKVQGELTLRGRQKEITKKYLFKELDPLRAFINSLIAKISELKNEENSEFMEVEDDTKYVQNYKEILKGLPGPGFIMNSEKNLAQINPEAEDITGIRESSGVGQPFMDLCREQGLAGTILELCENSTNSQGMCQTGNYELGGKDYQLFVNTLLGKDGSAKAYLITLKKSI